MPKQAVDSASLVLSRSESIKEPLNPKPPNHMPLHTLSAELLRMILQHAPERKRVQVLLTHKGASVLLKARKTAAQAAFGGLKAELEGVCKKNWCVEGENRIEYREKERLPHGSSRHSTYHVSLNANGIITIDASTVFFSATCERQGELKTTNDFHAWMCSEARGTLGFIDGALVRHSTRTLGAVIDECEKSK